GETMRELARRVIDISAAGLSARARLGSAGDNEGGFLDPLRDVVASGLTPADRMLAKYHGEWNGDVSHIYEEYSF
ncbi:MAG: glutamate--cysteine ligase, partial [Sphingomicrobium sp.]